MFYYSHLAYNNCRIYQFSCQGYHRPSG